MAKKKQMVVNVRTGKARPVAGKKKKAASARDVTILGGALRQLGGLAGGALGGVFGAPTLGAAAGTGLGGMISRWLGSGDYSVSQNSLVSSVKASGSIPMMHSDGQSIIVRHKEFVTEVRSSTSFTVQRSYTINPGNATTFPWLARLANSYQQYRIRGMVFHYVPTSGSAVASTNNALGSVMLQTSYRSNDDPPSSKIELLNEYWASEAMPCEAFCHPLECNPNENPFNVQYVRASDALIPTNDSPLLYDMGTTHLCTSGQQADGIVLGDLWVTYEIELKKPIISSNVTSNTAYYTAFANSSSPTFSTPFPNTVTNRGNLPLRLNGRVVTIPANIWGTFWFIVSYECTSGSFTNLQMTGAPAIVGGTIIQFVITAGGGADRYEINTTGTQTRGVYAFACTKSSREQVANITLPTATVSSGTLNVAIISAYGEPDL
nr:structural protein [Tolivirales sp.]